MHLKEFLSVSHGLVRVMEKSQPSSSYFTEIAYKNASSFVEDTDFMDEYGNREVNAIHILTDPVSGSHYFAVHLKDKA